MKWLLRFLRGRSDDMKDFLIVECRKPGSSEKTLLNRSLRKIPNFDSDFDYVQIENSESLFSVFNHYLEHCEHKYLVFIHDDLYIDDFRLKEKLLLGFRSYDICGIAGGLVEKSLLAKEPIMLWHRICAYRYGCVHHFDSQDETKPYRATGFGPTPSQTDVLDGIFIAIDVKKVREKKLKWASDCPSNFHFYDISFSAEATLNGLVVGVIPIHAIHRSHGLPQIDQSYRAGNEWFIHTYKKRMLDFL